LSQHLVGLGRGLPDPASLLAQAARQLDDLADDLPRALRRRIERAGFRVSELASRLRRPDEILNDARHRLTRQGDRLDLAIRAAVRDARARSGQLEARLTLEPVRRRLPEHARALGRLGDRTSHAAGRRILDARRQLDGLASRLESVSHESVLRRGFVLVRDQDGSLVGDAASAKRLALLELEFHDGRVRAVPGEPRRKGGRAEPVEQARLL
jgi:exodeoxyribonuclease VII large subunit